MSSIVSNSENEHPPAYSKSNEVDSLKDFSSNDNINDIKNIYKYYTICYNIPKLKNFIVTSNGNIIFSPCKTILNCMMEKYVFNPSTKYNYNIHIINNLSRDYYHITGYYINIFTSNKEDDIKQREFLIEKTLKNLKDDIFLRRIIIACVDDNCYDGNNNMKYISRIA